MVSDKLQLMKQRKHSVLCAKACKTTLVLANTFTGIHVRLVTLWPRTCVCSVLLSTCVLCTEVCGFAKFRSAVGLRSTKRS